MQHKITDITTGIIKTITIKPKRIKQKVINPITDADFLTAKFISKQNMNDLKTFHEMRIKTHTDKPKIPTFEVSRSEPKTDRIKSLATYERRIAHKIRNITDISLLRMLDEFKADKFKFPVIHGFNGDSIDLTKLNEKYQELISGKHESKDLNKDDKKYRQNESKKRSYYRLKAEKVEAIKNAINSEKWKKERLKTHISDSIIADYEKRLTQKDVIPLTHKPLAAITKIAQKCLTTYELINDIKLFRECKTLLEESTLNTSGIRDWKKDYWNSHILHKGKITSLKQYSQRQKEKTLKCSNIDGEIFYL